MESKGNVGVLLKIIGVDFSKSAEPVPFQVFDGLVLVDGKPLLPHTSFPCQQSTGYCGSLSPQNTLEIYRALVPPRPVAIAFSRQPKGLDITLPLDIPQETLNSRQFDQFNDCMKALIQRAMANPRQ
jgi:hypothetical protein